MANTTTISIESTNPDDPPMVDSQPEEAIDKPFLAEDSQSDVTVEQREKETRRGRPSRQGAPPGSAPLPTSTQTKATEIKVPDPKFKTYYSDSENPHQKTKAFWNWWNQLPGAFKERCVAYVYRDWPVLITLDRDETDELTSIDCISGMEPIQNDADLNDRYGAGDFHIFFNEALKPGKRTLCKLYVRGSRDLKSRPPSDRRINDVNQVEMNDPQNSGYIAFLRGRGLLPDQVTLAKKEGELASLQAAKEMSTTVERLTDKVIKMAEDKGKNSPGADDTLKILTQASINANEIQADAAKRSNEMLHETIRGMRELESNGKKEGGVAETLELVTSIIDKFGPKESDNAEVRELRAELQRVRDDRLKTLEDQLTALRAAPITGNASPSATMKESITAFKEMRDLVEDVVGGGKKSPVEEIAEEAGIPKWLQLTLQYGLPFANNILGTFMISRGMTPTPTPPMPGMPGMPGGMGGPGAGMGMAPPPGARPMPPTAPNPSQAPGTPGLPAPATQQSQPELTQNGVPTYGLHPDIADILFEQKTPIVQYLAAGDATGEDYAELFANTYGLPVFNMMAGFGKEALLLAITSFPPIMSRLGALSIGSDRLAQFAGEFCDFKPVLEDEEGEEGNGTGPGNTNGTTGAA